MTTETQKVDVSLQLHQEDYAAMERASRAMGVETSDFCLLAIHGLSRRTLAETGEKVGRVAPRSSWLPIKKR